jgi:hypothetical protein
VRDGQAEQEVFHRLLSAHDERWLMELTMLISWYCGIATFANAFEIEPAEGTDRLPRDQSSRRLTFRNLSLCVRPTQIRCETGDSNPYAITDTQSRFSKTD